jgi:hypothetical protein
MYRVNDIVTYKNQDGLVKIQLIKPSFMMIGFQVWNAQVLEVIKKASFGGNPIVGKVEHISERWFIKVEKV